MRAKDPSAVFLIETWSNTNYLEIIRCYFRFNNKFVVPSNNRGRGLALFWNNDLKLTVKKFSCHHIDTLINEGCDDVWRFTGIYGDPDTSRRSDTWTLLKWLYRANPLPWCVIGDFNEIVKIEEMKGRRQRPERQMKAFREVLDHYGLIDLRYVGSKFTWCNNCDTPNTTWVRLDRGVANIEWLNRFHAARVEHVNVTNSDHKCIHMQWDCPFVKRHRKPFRFEEMWLEDRGCEELVRETWSPDPRGTAMFRVATKINQCKRSLGEWSRRSFGSVRR